MNRQIIFTLLCALLSMSVLNAQVIKKVPKGYKAVEARIEAPDGEYAQILANSMVSDLKIWKSTRKGTILLRFKGIIPDNGALHYLIRLFDKNDQYLSHFETEKIYEALGMPTQE